VRLAVPRRRRGWVSCGAVGRTDPPRRTAPRHRSPVTAPPCHRATVVSAVGTVANGRSNTAAVSVAATARAGCQGGGVP